MNPTGLAVDVGVPDPCRPDPDANRQGSLFGLLPWAVGGAWILEIVAWAKGWGRAVGHDKLIEHGPPLWVALALFVIGWQVMLAAMMLPSSLTALRSVDGLISGRKDRHRLGAIVLVGYAAVWTGFGSLAFLGDIGLHRVVDGWPWLAARPWLIGGCVLALAGAFELSPLAGWCATRGGGLVTHLADRDRFGTSGAMRLGTDHGLRRLNRCWPLMLLSFAVGMASLGWMVALTLMMLVQESNGAGRTTRLMGVALLAVAGLVIAHPGWMPSLLPSSAR